MLIVKCLQLFGNKISPFSVNDAEALQWTRYTVTFPAMSLSLSFSEPPLPL
jgi:hypothetical protein